MMIKKLFLLVSCAFFLNSSAEKSVIRSACVATTGILATQVGLCVYYSQDKSALKTFVFNNKAILVLYVLAHIALNYGFFSVLNGIKNGDSFEI